MRPKGKLLIIGGAEDKGDTGIASKNEEFEKFEILKSLLPNGGNKSRKKIEIITTASSVPDEIKKMYHEAFNLIGFHNVGFIHMNNRIEAKKKSYIKRIQKASVVLFSGGDQFRISTILSGTDFAEAIREKYINDKDFLVAGTSAGAMVMSEIMISEGGIEEALLNMDLKTSSGLGLLEYCIVDTHFIKRGRFGRLAHAIVINPGQVGVGLGEDTALYIKNGTEAECHGSGMVVIIDGKDIGQTNITEVDEGSPVFVENLIVHLLVKGCRYSLKTRKLVSPAIKPKKDK